jgi:hypothetical protein
MDRSIPLSQAEFGAQMHEIVMPLRTKKRQLHGENAAHGLENRQQSRATACRIWRPRAASARSQISGGFPVRRTSLSLMGRLARVGSENPRLVDTVDLRVGKSDRKNDRGDRLCNFARALRNPRAVRRRTVRESNR